MTTLRLRGWQRGRMASPLGNKHTLPRRGTNTAHRVSPARLFQHSFLARAAESVPAPVTGQTETLARPTVLPADVIQDFEHKLEADIKTVGYTISAVTGVILYWRGVWSLLDYALGDSLFGDLCCIVVGLVIILWIRLSGVKVATSLWPPS